MSPALRATLTVPAQFVGTHSTQPSSHYSPTTPAANVIITRSAARTLLDGYAEDTGSQLQGHLHYHCTQIKSGSLTVLGTRATMSSRRYGCFPTYRGSSLIIQFAACVLQSCLSKNTYSPEKCDDKLRGLYLCCQSMYDSDEGKESTACPMPAVLQRWFKNHPQKS
jgi:hypothetical protein